MAPDDGESTTAAESTVLGTRTLHCAFRVTAPDTSLRFYRSLGFETVGTVAATPIGDLTMLKLPDDEVVSLELVHHPEAGPVDVGSGFSHLVVQTDDLEALHHSLEAVGIPIAPLTPSAPNHPRTAIVRDPDGYRIELVEWPAGHADGLTDADFA